MVEVMCEDTIWTLYTKKKIILYFETKKYIIFQTILNIMLTYSSRSFVRKQMDNGNLYR